jgi:hypothetical protein
MTDDTSKEQKAIVARSKPTLTTLGTRIVPSDGRFHPNLAADYIVDHGGLTRVIPIGELARVFYGGNAPVNKKRIRQRMYRIWGLLLARGHLLVILYEGSRAVACKLFDPRSTEERQQLQSRFERMERYRMVKGDQLERALELAARMEAEVAS